MNYLKKAAAVFTAALLIVNMTVFSFADSYATIKETSVAEYPLNYGGADYYRYKGTYTKNNKTYNETAHAVVVKPDALTKIEVTGGNTVYGRSTLSSKIDSYKSDGKKVIAAMNGDFFSSATGIPLGIQITNGIVRTDNNYKYELSTGRWSVGFKADGTAVVGQPDITATVTVGDSTLTPDRINSYPDTNFTILTSDYSDKTYWNKAFAHDVVILETNAVLSVNKSAGCTFVSYLKNVTEPVKIDKNRFYLIVPKGDTRLKNVFADKTAGQPVQVKVTDKTGLFNDAVTAIGGGSLLINNGVMRYPSTYDSSISSTLTSRSALGIKADGTVVLYAVERTSNGSTAGVWIEAVTQKLYDMGCVYAINFDGGGSTSFAAAKNGGKISSVVTGQDGSQRAVSNCILVVTEEKAPTVVEDFETETLVFDDFVEPDSLTTLLTEENAYTGNKALTLDYTLKSKNRAVTSLFETPIDLSAYDALTLSVDGNNSGVMLSVVLEKENKIIVTDIGRTNFKGYRHFEIKTDGAEKLRGFALSYVIASNNHGKVFVDRITGYKGFSLTDETAPTITLSQNTGSITATSSDGVLQSGKDGNGYYFSIDGEPLAPVFASGSATADMKTVIGDKTVRVTVDAVDIFGNRARKTALVKSSDFSRPLPFADVTEGKWDELYIRYCAENGIIAGMEENGVMMFKGSDSITRAQFCTMLVRKMGIDPEAYKDTVLPYEDADTVPSWALPYVKAAFAEGIMTGSETYTGVSFLAQNNITRAEAATAIDRIVVKDTRLSMQRTYTDEKDIANWAKPAVNSVTAQGLFDGDSDGRFYPKRNLTRSETSAIMTRI